MTKGDRRKKRQAKAAKVTELRRMLHEIVTEQRKRDKGIERLIEAIFSGTLEMEEAESTAFMVDAEMPPVVRPSCNRT